MRYLIIVIIVLFLLVSTALICAQGACTEAAIKEGKVELAKDAFSYMPPFGKPMTGKREIQSTAEKKVCGSNQCQALMGIGSSHHGFGIKRHGIRARNYGHELRRRRQAAHV